VIAPVSNSVRTILVVEDSDECATTLEILLGSMPDVEVRLTGSAEDALRVLESDRVAAVITDLHLPAMDGLEFVGRVRASSRHSAVPIVVISGDADPRMPQRALREGASAYFSKPYSPAAVRRALQELIHAK
jgi:CheY-like chemotaxis protein